MKNTEFEKFKSEYFENMKRAGYNCNAGWYIISGCSHYGPYSSQEKARYMIGRPDSLGMKIRGFVAYTEAF